MQAKSEEADISMLRGGFETPKFSTIRSVTMENHLKNVQ